MFPTTTEETYSVKGKVSIPLPCLCPTELNICDYYIASLTRYSSQKMRRGRANWICFLPECMIIACHGISIKSFVWIFFLFALISFVVTYVHVMIVLEMSGNDLQFGVNYDYLDVPSINLDRSKDWSLKNGKFRLGDDAREGKNMIATKIIESPLTEIHGWWMPNVKWTAEINCKTGLSHICRKVTYMTCVG
ncbi:hypothetical protein BSL78_13822 [Apostichopus japonicus]|uniref:Uncharacterized protein n=1 Tax=Stichopus japonicus TaxID=307972 RepID=A0A2G8KMW1_STIJA|nr:hypothetical protein BSL78_13822 [Apostichopus japonicus]